MPKGSKRAGGQKAPSSPARVRKTEPRARQLEKRQAGAGRGRRQYPYLAIAGAAVAAIVVLAALFFIFTQGSKPAYDARQVADQGRDHIVPGQPHPSYNTTPPTSGWHYEQSASWGIHDKPIDDETQVHNLEHGGIMVQYSCSDGCPDLVAQLTGVVKRYPSKVILSPYAKPLPNRIALTAWNWIDTFDDFDDQRIVSFVDAHKNRGPEQVPD